MGLNNFKLSVRSQIGREQIIRPTRRAKNTGQKRGNMTPTEEKTIKLIEMDSFWKVNDINTIRSIINQLIKKYKEQDELLQLILDKN